ncbi:MAG TPA: type II toxin-antitoxin system death-on-curing family toxin [Stellaceae bacterium]|nr:type II toxin-antitoxin system death-on-curing family toxin [Stellaceae bacterium]
MPNEPRWLSVEAVIDINRRLVAITGERHLLRDEALLEGALARPQHAYAYGEEDVAALAVRLLAGIVQSHAFEQGNKRTGFVAMVQFLMENGYGVTIEDNRPWAEEVIALVEHHISEDDFVAALRPFVVARSP